jgi:TonB family protein
MALIKILICCFLFSRAMAQTVQEQLVTCDYRERPLRSVLCEIGKRTGIDFIFQDRLIDLKKITFRTEDTPLVEALKVMLREQNLSFKILQSKSFVLYERKLPERKEYVRVLMHQNLTAMDTSEAISEPKIISSTILKYPLSAIKDKLAGKVILKVYVNKDGLVPRAIIEKSSGSGTLDSCAIASSGSLRFTPAKANGNPINIWISVLFNYLFDTKQ